MLVPETRESKITSVKGKWFQYDWNTECEGGYENRGSLTKEPSSQVTAHKRLPAVSVGTGTCHPALHDLSENRLTLFLHTFTPQQVGRRPFATFPHSLMSDFWWQAGLIIFLSQL